MQSNTYDQVAQQYADYLTVLRQESFSFNHDLLIPLLLQRVGEVAGLRVLDAGCGEGIVARLLASAGARVVGIDVAPRLIELAQAHGGREQIEYVAHDLSQPLPQYAHAFDLVVSNLVINDVPDYQGFIHTLGAVTKPAGRVCMSLNNPYSALIREKVANYFDSGKATLYNMAKDGVEVYYFHRTLEEYFAAFLAAGFGLRGYQDVRLPQEIYATLPDRYRQLPYAEMYDKFPFFLYMEFVKLP